MRLMSKKANETQTKVFNNDGQLFAVRRLTSSYEDSFIWGLLGINPTFREVWISQTWLMRRTLRDVLLRSSEGYKAACRSCPIYSHYKNLFDPLRLRIERRLWKIKYKSIDDRRRKRAG